MRIRILAVVAIVLAVTATGAAADPPGNDDIAGATTLVAGVEQRLSTVDATSEPGENTCGSGNTAWFSFTASGAGDYLAYATGSDFDSYVEWSDSLGDSTGDCLDDAADSYDSTTEPKTLALGEQEFVQIDTVEVGNWGTGGVGVVQMLPPADDFASATMLTIATESAATAVSFTGSEGSEVGEPTTCGTSTLDNMSVWFDFVSPTSGTWMFESKGKQGTTLAVYTGPSVDALTLVSCAVGNRSATLADLTAGATYRVRVGTSTPGEPIVVRAERAPTALLGTAVDDTRSAGTTSSLAILGNGDPIVSYYDDDNSQLRIAERSGAAWSDSLVDADGDGTSSAVGEQNSLAILDTGEPAVAYTDSDNSELRYAERSGGVWTDVSVAAGGAAPHLIVLANGEPALAFMDRSNRSLGYAERSGGVWTVVEADPDGDGTSPFTGSNPSLAQRPNGNVLIAYGDRANGQVRFAERSAGVWSDSTVWTSPGQSFVLGGLVLDSTGAPRISASTLGHHLLALWNGATWEVEFDRADRNMAEYDGGGCAPSRLLIDSADNIYLPWLDCNYSQSIGISIRTSMGGWSTADAAPYFNAPSSAGFEGNVELGSTTALGATWLADGRLAITAQRNDDSSLWLFEGSLKADAGPDVETQAPTPVQFSGSGSDDWGAVAAYEWTGDLPDGCVLADASAVAPTLTCQGEADGELTLTVTDTDGLTHSDVAAFAIAAPPQQAYFCNGLEATIVGTNAGDEIQGTAGADVIVGLGGDDTIHGLGGNDTICGNHGIDILMGGTGNDVILGGRNSDHIRGEDGNDVLRGETGHDNIRGGGGDDTIGGGQHKDIIRGGAGHDDLRGDRGNDTVEGNSGNDTVRGGKGVDALKGGSGIDICRGGPNSDFATRCETRRSAQEGVPG